MPVDPAIRRSILQILCRDRHAYVASSEIAEELRIDLDLIEASLDVMQEDGLLRVQRYIGGGCNAMITPRGYLEPVGKTAPAAGAPETPTPLPLQAGEARGKLQEQLEQLNKLAKRRTLTLGDIEAWRGWTETVIRRAYGDTSRQSKDFEAVMEGHWRGLSGPNLAGYRNRLPRWRALLTTWVREFDEFGSGAPPAERYIPSGSQLDAYVALKDTVGQAARSLVVVDPYVDDSTLQPLLAVKPTVGIRVLTVTPSKDFAHALERFREQWKGTVEARVGPKHVHDRFLLLDGRVFLSGASLKDLGQRASVLLELHSEAAKAAIRRDVDKSWNAAQAI